MTNEQMNIQLLIFDLHQVICGTIPVLKIHESILCFLLIVSGGD